MNPDTFHDLLDRDTALPPPPPAPGVELAEGRRRLLQRRLGAAAAGVVATVVVIGGAAVVGARSDPGHAHDPVAEAPRSDDQGSLLSSCKNGNQSRKATDAIFGSGTPAVRNVVQTDYQIVVALESADGAYWADCWVHLLSAEFSSGMTVYPSDPAVQDAGVASVGTSYAVGPGCGLVDGDLDPSCDTWFVQWVDRLPHAVSTVRFALADGTTVTAPSRGGYVVLNVLHPLGGAVSYSGRGGLDVDLAISRIDYLDASGNTIASEQASMRGGPRGGPRLSTYPSLRGAPIG